MDFSKFDGSRHDLPLIPGMYIPASVAGTGTDFEIPLFYVSDLTKTVSSGESGMLRPNNVGLRTLTIDPIAAITGAATNFCQLAFRQWRAGAPINFVNTTSATTISASTMAVTPASLQNMYVGQILYISGGTGTAEYVVIASINSGAGTYTATYANSHSGAYTIVSTYLAAVQYLSGVNEVAQTPHQFNPPAGTNVKAGDTITLQRLSFGTGLATPAMSAFVEFTSLMGSAARG